MNSIKFEIINGTLYHMVEPTPLTPDSQFPCLVRLIQDDSPMGKYNRRLRDVALDPLLVTGIDKNSEVVSHNNPRPRFYPECYEIIGYPVVDGSAEWALWQHINGNVLSNPKHGLFRWKYRSDSTAWDCIKVYQDGWIIASEPEESHPKRWVCFECGVKDSRKGHFYDCKRTGSPIVKQAEKPVSDATQPCEVCDGIGMISCEACNASGRVAVKPEPEPAYAVGDYVLPINSAAEPYLIVGHLNGDYIVRNLHQPWCADFVAPASQLRKISAKDVKLKFEIVGTVSKHPNTDQLFTIHTGDFGEYFTVRMSDIPEIDQRNVKELLEKQVEGK